MCGKILKNISNTQIKNDELIRRLDKLILFKA